LSGEYGSSCTPEWTRETANRMKGEDAKVVDGIVHFPMSENPDYFREFLLPILQKISNG